MRMIAKPWSLKDSITGKMLIYLLPAAILLPFFIVFLQWLGNQWGFFSGTLSLILFAALTIILFVIIICIVAIPIRKAEIKLQRSEQLSQLLIANRKDYAIFMLDPEGKITSWNAGAERLTGYKADEILGESSSSFYTLEDKQQNKPSDFLKLAAKQKQLEYEGWRVHKSGRRFWAITTISALFDENNQLIGFTKLVRNATRQKEADDKLMQSVSSLERSNKELERFAYIASHDLQEPLRMVASFTQLLQKKYQDKLDEEANEYIHFAVDGALRMQQLITDLLAYSRIATKGKPFVSTDCETIVKQVIRNLSVVIQETHAEITHDALPSIVADDTQMLQVFQNLLSNAIKFHKNDAPPKIHISAKYADNSWIFCIKDNGIGIASEHHEQVFLIFHRLHGRQEYSGTGIGLAICKKIIERHGGKMWVESEFGKGAKFCFTIPM